MYVGKSTASRLNQRTVILCNLRTKLLVEHVVFFNYYFWCHVIATLVFSFVCQTDDSS